MPLLSSEFLARLSRYRLGSRARAPGNQGAHRGIRRGQSQEFADYRPYVPGDDLRFLDWHLLARLDTLWTRLFEEERDRVVHLLVDSSASMQGEKLDTARKLAAALGWVALGGTDRVLYAGLAERVASLLPSGRGRAHAAPLFAALEAQIAAGKTDLGAALAALPRAQGSSYILLFTDMLLPQGAEPTLRRALALGAHVHLFHMVAPEEISPPLRGEWVVIDAETQEEVAVTLDEVTLAAHRAHVLGWIDETAQLARHLGVGYTLVSSDIQVETWLYPSLSRAGVLK